MKLLDLKNINFSWPLGEKALDNCSFSIPSSGLWMLVGSNGSGKSTLFRLISGLITADSGQINCYLKPALMFQNPDHQLLLPSCGSDILLNISEDLSTRKRHAKAKEVLEAVGLQGMERRPILLATNMLSRRTTALNLS